MTQNEPNPRENSSVDRRNGGAKRRSPSASGPVIPAKAGTYWRIMRSAANEGPA